jgi:U3 small nucleolar RNA-associated protein 19
LIDAELGKNLKKTPVVEYQIPKTIFTEDGGGLNQFGRLMTSVIDAT